MRRQAQLMRAAIENHGEMMPPVAVASDTNNKEQLLPGGSGGGRRSDSSNDGSEFVRRRRRELSVAKNPSRPAVGAVRDAIGHQKRHNPPIKLKEYSGRTSIETFFQQFRTCAAYYHWTEEDKGVYLRCQLTGNAANLLWALPNSEKFNSTNWNGCYEQDLDRPSKRKNFRRN